MRSCVKRFGERIRSCLKLGETLREGQSERLRERLGERFGEMLCTRLCEMLDPDMLQVYFRQASSRIQ